MDPRFTMIARRGSSQRTGAAYAPVGSPEVSPWLYEGVCGGRLTRAGVLWTINLVCMLAHFTFAMVTIGESTKDGSGMDTPTLSLYMTNLTWNNNSVSNALTPSLVPSEGLQLAHMTLWFFLLSALAHGTVVFGNFRQAFAMYGDGYVFCGYLYATRKITPFSGFYYAFVQEARNPIRWLEYSFSASLMVVAIAVASGVNTVNEITMAFVLMWSTMTYGYFTEALSPVDVSKLGPTGRPMRWELNKDNPNANLVLPDFPGGAALQRLAPHLLGYVPYSTIWSVLMFSFFHNASGGEGGGPPAFVYAIVISQIVVFTLFGFLQFFNQMDDNGPSWYFQVEIGYCVLSLVAKGILGGILITTVLLYSNFEEAVEAA